MDRIKIICRNNRVISINVENCGFLGKVRGLMFRRKSKNLLFDNFSGAIHSWFVFFPFVAVWLDDKNRVLEIKMVKPFTFHIKSKKHYTKLIEVPINEGNKELVDFLVGEEKFK